MILLDTNVVSEMMRPLPATKVVNWLDAWPVCEVWISSITISEILLGIALLQDGKRKSYLYAIAEQMFSKDFSDRCLHFDCEAANEYSWIVAARSRQGRPISVEDAQIASIAVIGGLIIATRNIKDFTGIEGLDVVNPWD